MKINQEGRRTKKGGRSKQETHLLVTKHRRQWEAIGLEKSYSDRLNTVEECDIAKRQVWRGQNSEETIH